MRYRPARECSRPRIAVFAEHINVANREPPASPCREDTLTGGPITVPIPRTDTMSTPLRLFLESAGHQRPSPSDVALAIIELWGDEHTAVQQLSSLIRTDPALSGQMLRLRLANSAAIGDRPVAAISYAIVRVGMQAVGQLAVSYPLIDGRANGPCRGFDYGAYWSHCLLMAVLSRGLARRTGLAPPEDLFACGLLSRIGILALTTVYPQEYSELLALEPRELTDAEKKRFGIDHNELTRDLMLDHRSLRRWQSLPPVTSIRTAPASNETPGRRNWRTCSMWLIDWPA